MNFNEKKEKGMSLLEVLLAVAVFAIGIGTVAHLYFGSYSASLESVEKNQALSLAKEGLSAVRSIGCDDPKLLLENIDADCFLLLRGNLESKGSASSVDVRFEWGEETGGAQENDLVNVTSWARVSETGTFEELVPISSEELAESYLYRFVIYDYENDETSYGEIVTLTP